MSYINDIYEFEKSFRNIEKLTLKCVHLKNAGEYIYIYIPLFCPGRALMVDIFIIFRVQHYFRVQILAFSGQ